MATFLHLLITSAAVLSVSAWGTATAAATRSHVWPGTICGDDSSSETVQSWMSAGRGQVRDAPARQRRPAGDIDQLPGVLGPEDHLVVGRHVTEELRMSISCWKCVPIWSWYVWPVMARTGA